MNSTQAKYFIIESLLEWVDCIAYADFPYDWYKDGLWVAGASFDPCLRLDDAWRVAEELFDECLVRKHSVIIMSGKKYRAWLSKDKREAVAHGETPSLAIANAILKFYGKEEVE